MERLLTMKFCEYVNHNQLEIGCFEKVLEVTQTQENKRITKLTPKSLKVLKIVTVEHVSSISNQSSRRQN